MYRYTKHQKLKRTIALTLLASFLNSILYPTISYGLTPPSNMPEYASFEPVDATDMVGLLTGDFNYTVPIIDVPGPEGGYPLAMFYHAGISPAQEASWLGLGWNINPGSINRFVKGVPDDFKRQESLVTTYSGSTNVVNWDVSIGVGFSEYCSLGISVDGGTNRSIGGAVYYSAKVGDAASVGGYMGTKGVGVTAKYGFTSAVIGLDRTGKAFGQVSVSDMGGLGSVGVSLSTTGVNTFLNTGPVSTDFKSALYSQNVNSYYLSNISIMGQIYMVNFSANYTKTKFWSYKREYKRSTGSLYMSLAKYEAPAETGGVQYANYISDVYDDPFSLVTYRNAQLQANSNSLTFPSYDSYQVTAQGLSGSMSPRIYEFGTLTQTGTNYDNNGLNVMRAHNDYRFPFTKTYDQVYFKFNYEPGGYMKVAPITFPYLGNNGSTDGMSYTYSGGGFSYSKPVTGEQFYNISNKRFGKGKFIQWFTNDEINSQFSTAVVKGFIETESQLGKRNTTSLYDPDGIGAFSITTEDGKCYHYSVPVYEFESYQVFEDKQDVGNGAHLVNHKINKYAYDWLLTSITGPDYIDRGTIGQIDDQDYGYWVKFDYGKWTDGYQWRTPTEDGSYQPNNTSSESQYGEYSIGRKQIYYLNSIQTKTHTAYFVKSLREDGRGKNVSLNKSYSFDEQRKAFEDDTECNKIKKGDSYQYKGQTTISMNPSGEANYLLKLDKIILMNNSDMTLSTVNGANVFKAAVNGGGGSCLTSYREKWYRKNNTMASCSNNYYPAITFYTLPAYQSYFQDNVLDVKDIQTNLATVEQKALKIIQFNQDYSLCGNTTNSTAPGGGKLTLNAVKIYGQGKADVLPGYTFAYNNSQTSSPIFYNKDNMDNWGYYSTQKSDAVLKNDAAAWSLNEIQTPLGSKIKVNYESDTYSREAVFSGLPEIVKKVTGSAFIDNDTKLEITIDDMSTLQITGALKIGKPYLFYGRIASPHGGNPEAYGNFVSTLLSYDINQKKLVFDEKKYDTNLPVPQTITFEPTIYYGGGLRVKDISLYDEMGNAYKTVYSYNNPATNNTSGVTSYAPTTDTRFVPYVYEIPSPSVMYEYVTVEDQGLTNNSYVKTRYKFDVLKNGGSLENLAYSLGNHFQVENKQNVMIVHFNADAGTNHKFHTYARSSIVHDNSSAVGRVLEVAALNKSNQVQNKVSYTYFDATEATIPTGFDQESFLDVRRNIQFENIGYGKSHSNFMVTSSSRITYPSILKSVVTESNGMSTTVTNTAFDFYTGAVTQTETENSYGEKYRNKNYPAYTKYGGVQVALGSKIYDFLNKNMLSQEAQSDVFVVSAGTEKLISSSQQTWQKTWNYRELISGYYTDNSQTDVWRKCKGYIWKADVDKDGSLVTASPNYQLVEEITRYDHFSEPIESYNISNIYSAIKRGGTKGNFTIASSSTSNYQSFCYSGFEDLLGNGYFGGEVNVNSGIQEASNASPGIKPHTGKYYVKLPASTYGPTYFARSSLQVGKTYQAAVWVHKNSAPSTSLWVTLDGTINGSPQYMQAVINIQDPKVLQVGDWKLLKVELTVPSTYIHSGGPYGLNDLRVFVSTIGTGTGIAYIDDMRLQPVNSNVSGYVYDESRGLLTASLDNENFATIYTYDAANRLIKIEKETALGLKKLSETTYHYGRQ